MAILAMPLHGQDARGTFPCRPQGRRYDLLAAAPRWAGARRSRDRGQDARATLNFQPPAYGLS